MFSVPRFNRSHSPHKHTHLWSHTNTHLWLHTHTHIWLHTLMVYKHIYVYIHFTNTHIWSHTNTHIWLHTHTHIWSHTNTHILILLHCSVLAGIPYIQCAWLAAIGILHRALLSVHKALLSAYRSLLSIHSVHDLLQLVYSLKNIGLFCKRALWRKDILQKWPVVLRSLLIIATS